MIVHTFNPSTREAESRWISEFKASLDYRARTNQRNLASENNNKCIHTHTHTHTHTHKHDRVKKREQIYKGVQRAPKFSPGNTPG